MGNKQHKQNTHQGLTARHHSSTAAPPAATDNHPVIDCRAPFFGSFFGEAKKEQPRNEGQHK